MISKRYDLIEFISFYSFLDQSTKFFSTKSRPIQHLSFIYFSKQFFILYIPLSRKRFENQNSIGSALFLELFIWVVEVEV